MFKKLFRFMKKETKEIVGLEKGNENGEYTIILGGEERIDVFPDLQIPIDKKKDYRIISIEEEGKKIRLGVYKKGKIMSTRFVTPQDLIDILVEKKFI